MATIDEYIKIEQNVQNLFLNSELKDHFEIRTNVRWRSRRDSTEFDIVIYDDNIIYAIVEIKTNLNSVSLYRAKYHINQALKLTKCRFGIITDNSTFLIIDSTQADNDFVKKEFNQIVQILIGPDHIVNTNERDNNIKKALSVFFNNNNINTILNNIKYNDSQGFYIFSNIDKERTFFLSIIGSLCVDDSVFRYTTLDSLITMLRNGTYRMSGIVGMNDKSEIDYFDKKCKILDYGSSTQDINDTYISSCSKLKDDLTMWRLYGNDGKGVCLEFELSTECKSNDFILSPVNYAEDKKKHLALKMLQMMSDAKFRFVELYKWKHFFKSYNFNVEKEIRLMFIDNRKLNNGVINRDWVITWNHSIINPVIDFKLNSSNFPIKLKRIILGSKMPELHINKIQLEYLISTKGYSIEVQISEIDNYR